MGSVIYCNDLTALKDKLVADGYYDEESGNYILEHTLTPLKYNGNTSLSYCNKLSLDLSEYTMLEDLGDYDEMFNDEVAHSKYKSVYPYDIPLYYTDDEGVSVEYYRPRKIGGIV